MARIDPWGLLFPGKCVLCGRLGESLCSQCAQTAPRFSGAPGKLPHVQDYTALWYYENQVRAALLDYKFQGKRHYGAVFGRLLADKLKKDGWLDFDCIVYVPVSRRRKFSRGYDQVRLIAAAAGKQLGLKPERVLKKVRHNPAQSSLNGRQMRQENVANAYRVTKPKAIFGKRVLLIDDIITTGATASECARTLLTSGASQVVCCAVAASRGRCR